MISPDAMNSAYSDEYAPPPWQRGFWVVLPLMLLLMVVVYVVAALTMPIEERQVGENVLVNSADTIDQRAAQVYQAQRTQAQRLASDSTVQTALLDQDEALLTERLEAFIEPDFDSLILIDAAGTEQVGLSRVGIALRAETLSDLATQPFLQELLAGRSEAQAAILETEQAPMIYTAVPVVVDGDVIGVALAGQRLDRVLSAVRGDTVADVALYTSDGAPLESSFARTTATTQTFRPDNLTVTQILATGESFFGEGRLDNNTYRVLYEEFVFGPETLGIKTVLILDELTFVDQQGRWFGAALWSGLAAAVVIFGFAAYSVRWMQRRETNLSGEKLSSVLTETGVMPTVPPASTPQPPRPAPASTPSASAAPPENDLLHADLRRQRREQRFALSMLESIPDPVFVQDRDANLIAANRLARDLLSPGFDLAAQVDWFQTAAYQRVSQKLGPGLYALGESRRVALADRLYSGQAAAVTSADGTQRLGTLLLLHDITDAVQQARQRNRLFDDLAPGEAPLEPDEGGDTQKWQQTIARDFSRHTAALQKMILDMRELTRYSRQHAEGKLRPLPVDTLIWALANDWRQIARAAEIDLQVLLQENDLYVLGDESRLRWAIGNIIDNAIKYTPSGGSVAIELKEVREHNVVLRVRDSGVGIIREELDHVMEPFYRGTPTLPNGEILRVPGMGQGLPQAQKVLEAHGGKLWIKTRPGVGTAVYVVLPLTSGAAYALPGMHGEIGEGETIIISPDTFDDSLSN